MTFSRTITYLMRGDDVTAVKKRLLELGYLAAATNNRFGSDSRRAIKKFQDANNLEETGTVNIETWAALFAPDTTPTVGIPLQIGKAAAQAIAVDLMSVSPIRREICLEALKYAVDPYNPSKYPIAFYIRGGNLYNKDLTLNVMSKSKLTAYVSIDSYKPYYDGGRQGMMEDAAKFSGYKNPGADCSGFIVGILRLFKLISAGKDMTANTLYGSYCVKVKKPQPGDWCWKSGHIGIYVGGGYVVEFAGGAWGCQLTELNRRVVYCFETFTQNGKTFYGGKLYRLSKWTAYGDPKLY